MSESETTTKKADIIIDGVKKGINKPVEKKNPVQETKRGVVTNCLILAIRKTPDRNGEIVDTIKYGCDVFIDLEKSTDEFYKVDIKNGSNGFCSKSFIKVQ